MPGSGEFKSRDSNHISAHLLIDDVAYIFVGTTNEPTPAFTSNFTPLEYASLDDFKGEHQFTGTIGTDSFSLTFNNGVKASGGLKQPIPIVVSVEGKGVFSHH